MVTISPLDRPRPAPRIIPDTVHVWLVRLDGSGWRERLRPGCLSADELVRAGRLAFEPLRRRFVLGRAALREILGCYLGRSPADLTFGRGPHGKPYLLPARDNECLRFNLSHSDDLAMVALIPQRAVGVDLERMRPMAGIDDMVARYFAPAERLAFAGAPAADRLSVFYRYWTLKEAHLKASGVGLDRPAAAVDVGGAEGRPLCLSDVSGALRYWRSHVLHPADGYCGALAVEGRADVAVRMLGQWPPVALTPGEAQPTVGATAPHDR